MRDHQDQDVLVQRGPAKDVVLAEFPVAAQRRLDVHQVTALSQPHLLGEAGQLVQIRRIVGYSPYPRFRQILYFHRMPAATFATAQSLPQFACIKLVNSITFRKLYRPIRI